MTAESLPAAAPTEKAAPSAAAHGSGRPLLQCTAAFAAYAALFAILAWPWLRVMDHAVPVNDLEGTPSDMRLIIWILASVARALWSDPRHLFDAPIFFPAPLQLAGSEALLSTQLAFAPLFLAGRNATLAACATLLLSYPLAALAMSRLLLALGCRASVAWVGGLLFALGPLRVPANLQALQYPSLYLPLLALALTHLRRTPGPGNAALLALVAALAATSSFYMAAIAGVAAMLWGAAELARNTPGRARFAALACAAAVVASATLLAVALPYLVRGAAGVPRVLDALDDPALATVFARNVVRATLASGWVTIALAAGGCVALGAGDVAARTAARRGLLLAIAGCGLMLGPAQWVGGVRVPLPFAILGAAAPFFRIPLRFAVLAGFGTTLLAAAALQAIGNRAGKRAGLALCTAIVLASVATHGRRLASGPMEQLGAQQDPIYDRVREAALERGAGPLLELPHAARRGDTRSGPDAMVGSTRHGLPLVLGYTGYPPPHRGFLETRIRRLRSGRGLADLVDATHLGWILLRPAEQWDRPTDRAAIARLRDLEHVLSSDGWDLYRVTLAPRHPEWFAALAHGPRPGQTVLGTPLVALDAPQPRLRRAGPPAEAAPGAPLTVPIDVENGGAQPWPAALAIAGRSKRLSVELRARLVGPTGDGAERRLWVQAAAPLPRDLAPGETLRVPMRLRAPEEPGSYELEVGLRQLGSTAFAGDAPLRVPLRVVPTAPAGAPPPA